MAKSFCYAGLDAYFGGDSDGCNDLFFRAEY